MTDRSRWSPRTRRGIPRELATPEGIPMQLRLADGGERATGFLLDLIFLVLGLFAVALLVELAGGGELVQAVALLFVFVVRQFYFIIFEIRWQGRTPGKRIMGTRVISRDGGPLTAQAIVARNLVRDIEVFIPVGYILQLAELPGGLPGWMRLLAIGWALVLLLMPLFNADRLRIGDMVAGTMVIVAPREVLLPDIAGAPVTYGGRPSAEQPVYAFADEQLDVYGIYELQVLENVLRDAHLPGGFESVQTVCQRIQTKIGWDRRNWNVEPSIFLRDFYNALRARLEKQMLFGKRREDKYSGPQER